MTEPRRSVPVTIRGHEYKVRGNADPKVVKKAATLLDETMERIQGSSGNADSVDVAVLAGLNLANHVVVLRDQADKGSAVDGERLDDLLGVLEDALADAPA